MTHHAIRGRSDGGIIEFLIVRGHAYIELHPARMQVGRKFIQQRNIARLPRGGKSLEIDHQPAEMVRRKKNAYLLVEIPRARPGLLRKPVMSPTQSAPLKLFTMGKTSMLGSSALRNGITRSSTERT